jgi:hypothetical protein
MNLMAANGRICESDLKARVRFHISCFPKSRIHSEMTLKATDTQFHIEITVAIVIMLVSLLPAH